MLRHSAFRSLAFGFIVWPAGADDPSRHLLGAPCFEACQWTLRPVRFNDTAGLSPSPRVRSCQSRLALTSLYLCTRVYCTDGERIAGLDVLNSTCQGSTQSPIPPFDLVANYTDGDTSNVRRLQKDEWDDAALLPEAVIPSGEFFGLAFDTLVCSLSQ